MLYRFVKSLTTFTTEELEELERAALEAVMFTETFSPIAPELCTLHYWLEYARKQAE